ncbi:MAG: CRISPR-ssociated protein, Cas1 [Leptospirillum sp. Group II 'C75']|uniref:CRISPR-associated protein, Cas1 n=2 Tax=Leptospirillum sp. Group II TaxID=261385 RepID=B6AMW4_9BACT|nr:MAG: CRISPR-ssociated protein, Cas1 [Leptospirillum rubarum]EDZ39838.1 MAG: CRISPR-associated protein, Cas1 [Leptospirillum sp. Group II '5-way CG']EIJ76633.1 MAG: CRISPR-ssociated protein, Cas1 [Leptospirillum sp. Group II 'C75']
MRTMRRYNLIDEKWIPVRFPDGRLDELGIRETLLRSKEIAVIEDPSPFVVASLYRFLLAILYRTLEGPTDIDKAKDLFKNGLPADRITAYLEKWRDRFWLFDEQFPFFQIPTFEPKELKAWTVLAAEHNADNAKVLFDHVDVTAPGVISEAMASRWILATQTFSVSSGKSELAHTGSAPSAISEMVIPLGASLQDTLLFSLVPQNRDIVPSDIPVWERYPESVEDLKSGLMRPASGLADLYTWRTRSIRLIPDESGVSRLALASGVKHQAGTQIDPMVGYRIDAKKGKLPLRLQERGLWRDFDSLLPDGSNLAPSVIDHAVRLSRSTPERFPRSVMIVGQSNDQAKIEYWRMEYFCLPEAIIGRNDVRTEIRELLNIAEDAHESLRSASRSYARNILSHGDRKPRGSDISNVVKQMPSISWYWSRLESVFHEVLQSYTIDRDPDDIRCQWLRNVRNILGNAWEGQRTMVSNGDVWTIRAIVKSEELIFKKLNELDKEIEKYESPEEAS